MIIHCILLLSMVVLTNQAADEQMLRAMLGGLGRPGGLSGLLECMRAMQGASETMTQTKEIIAAIESDQEKKLMQLVQENPQINPKGYLHLAASKKSHKSLRALIEHGCDVNQCAKKTYPLNTAVIAGDVEGVRILLDAGAELESRGADGGTALNNACYKGSEEVFDLLLERGASVVARSHKQNTALHTATAEGNVNIIAKLLAQNVPCDVRNKYRATPLHMAIANNKIAAALALIAAGASVEATDRMGNTPLFCAVLYGSAEGMQILLANGANAHIKNKLGHPLVHTIVSAKTLHDEYKEKIEALLQAGVSIDVLDGIGCTPLEVALCCDHEDAALLLLEKGANHNVVNGDGLTPLAIAIQKGHYRVAEKLIEKGADPCAIIKGKPLIQHTRNNRMRTLLKNAIRQRQGDMSESGSDSDESDSDAENNGNKRLNRADGDDCRLM